ncbi:MAG: cysteine synthase family protein [Ardenticatenaceae bacterium]|nr:cysteine synthase family protein [Ardenticatenaceae bacterium]
MSEVPTDVTKLVGNTPLVRLSRLEGSLPQPVTLLAKLEWLNPGGSDKDRVAVAMLDAAEAAGVLTPDTVIIEPTSGNIGLSLAMACAVRSYHLVLTMPDIVPKERVRLLRALGAEVILTPGMRGMRGAVTRADALRKATPNSWSPRQFENAATAAAHEITGEEIWQQTNGAVDILVAGVGTGGIISGAGRRLKAHKPGLRSIAVQPAASPVLTGGPAGSHRIYGLGAPFIPAVYDADIVEEVVNISDDEAYTTLHRVMTVEGLFAGPGSGAAVAGALQIAHRRENRDVTIVVIMPDSIERYSATDALSEH